MSVEALLDLIRQRFSPSEGKILVKSLQQDPLVWQFVQNEKSSLEYFKTAPKDISAFTPGRMAAWLMAQKYSLSDLNLSSENFELPADLKKQAAQTFETVRNTGLPPADLISAGLLALSLRESKNSKGAWKGITDEILIERHQNAVQKNFRIWRTPFACLIQYCPDFEDIILDFLQSKSEPVLKTAIPVFIHAFLANPSTQETTLSQLFSFTRNLSVDQQLESLKWMESFQEPAMVEQLAKDLFQQKNNVDTFARVFSELEAFESKTSNSDPLEKQVRYTLPEDVNRLAAFYYFSGNQQKASETYKQSTELLEFIKAQSLFQSFASQPGKIASSHWMQIIKSVPGSKQARLFYIRSLLDEQKIDEAEKLLADLPESGEKKFLQHQIRSHSGTAEKTLLETVPPLQTQDAGIRVTQSGYYVHKIRLDQKYDILQTMLHQPVDKQSLSWVENNLAAHFNDPSFVILARDLYEKAENIDKAIELTSFLERIEPGEKNHKQDLARLYSQVDRWQESYSILQEVIKRDPSPAVKDLERFAEAALRTDRIDMSMSICQNILKQNDHNTRALVLLGEGYMQKGDIVKAIQHMEDVVEMIPEEAETWLSLARLWENNGQIDRAFEILNQGVLTLPNHPELLRALGHAHLEKQAPADALTYLKKAFEIEPDHYRGKIDLAQSEFLLGQHEQAYQILETYLNNYEDYPEAAKLLGHVLVGMGNSDAAEPILISAAKHYPADQQTVLAVTHIVLDRFETSLEELPQEGLNEIEEILNKASDLNPQNKQLKMHLADINRLKGQNQEALETYAQLSEAGPGEKSSLDWRLQYGLGKSAIGVGNIDVGLVALQDAASKQPENLMVLHSLSEAYQVAGMPDKAQNIAKSALRLAPQDLQNILWYADNKTKNNEPEEAVKALKEAIQMTPESSQLKLWLSKTQLSIGSIEDAKDTITDLLENTKATRTELQQAAYICVRLNELQLAVNALEKATEPSSISDPILIMDLSVCLSLMDQHKQALETLNVDDDLIRQYPQIAMLKSDLLSNLNRYESAFETLARVKSFSESALGEDLKESDQTEQSPLLYTYDLTYKGYLYRIGQLSRILGDIHEAQDYLMKAMDLAPDSEKFQNAAVEAFMMGLDFDKALEVADKAPQEKSNNHPPGQENLDLICSRVEILLEKKQFEQAAALFNRLSQVNRSHPRYLALQSRLAADLGEFEVAKDHLGEAIKAYQENFESIDTPSSQVVLNQTMNLNSMAEAALTLEDYQTAIQLHQKAWGKINTQPFQNYRYVFTLMEAAEKQQIANAISIINHAPGNKILSDEFRLMGEELLENLLGYLTKDTLMCLQARLVSSFTGKWPMSLNAETCLDEPIQAAAVILGSDDTTFVRDVLESYPDEPHVLQAYGIYALKYDLEDGVPAIEKAIGSDTSNPINHALLALLKSDDPERALMSLETALEFWPNEPEWHSIAADLQTKIGNTHLASRHIALALDAQPENSKYWQKSAEIKLNENSLYEAKMDLEKSAAFQAKDPNIWMKMADVNRRLGNMTEAIGNVQKASELDPSNVDIATQEVQFLLEQKNFISAETKANALLNISQGNSSARILLAKAQAKQGKFEQALETLAAAIEENPNDISLALENIKIKKVREGTEAVLPELVSLAAESPNDPEVLTTLTDWLIQTNRLEKAAETAQTILKIIPDQPDVHLMLGRLQRKNGQLDQAIAHLSDAIALDPNCVEAYLELGKTYQERRDLEKAISIFQKGSQANASDPRPYYLAGMALKECKDYTGAESMLKQAKRYSPDDPNIIRQLGVITALNLINNLREAR